MAAGAVILRKSHDIVILSFSDIVKGQAKCRSNMGVTHRIFQKTLTKINENC